MHARRHAAATLGLLAALATACADEPHECNVWPLTVQQLDPAGRVASWAALGPVLFKKPAPDGGTQSGVRPLWVATRDAQGMLTETTSLYPLFTYRASAESYQWTIFDLINRSGRKAGAPAPRSEFGHDENFDVWPFWFSKNTGDPARSYRALFPVAGTIKHRLFHDRLSWVLAPLYVVQEQKGAVTTSTPWPFVRITRGAETGFALWPLFGWRERPGVFHDQFYLWPLIWKNTRQPAAEAPAGTPPTRETGVLPFYTHESRAGYTNENFLWPFFGYSDRTAPYRYHETRYLWPFLVQGRGDDRVVNRWGPFYTHSIIKGTDKTWLLWPLFRHAHWREENRLHSRDTILWFVYFSEHQRSAQNPATPAAAKTHLWPLFSSWDNGAGRRQFQLLSPLEPLFADNPRARAAWSPLFALYRYDARAPDDFRHDALWGLLTWRREPARTEFHLGPLFSVETHADRRRIAIGNGLLGLSRSSAGGAWRLFWLDFSRNPVDSSAATPASP